MLKEEHSSHVRALLDTQRRRVREALASSAAAPHALDELATYVFAVNQSLAVLSRARATDAELRSVARLACGTVADALARAAHPVARSWIDAVDRISSPRASGPCCSELKHTVWSGAAGPGHAMTAAGTGARCCTRKAQMSVLWASDLRKRHVSEAVRRRTDGPSRDRGGLRGATTAVAECAYAFRSGQGTERLVVIK